MQNMSKVRRWGDNSQPKPRDAEYVQGKEITLNLNLEMQNMSKVRRRGDNSQPKPWDAEYI